MADSIQLWGIQVPAALGVTEAERLLRRPVEIDLELETDLYRAAASDDLPDTVDYVAVFEVISRIAGREHHLVETLAERICEALLSAFPRVDQVRIDARKVAPLPGAVRSAGVRLARRRTGA